MHALAFARDLKYHHAAGLGTECSGERESVMGKLTPVNTDNQGLNQRKRTVLRFCFCLLCQRLVLNSLNSLGWPWTHDHSASTSQILQLWSSDTVLSRFCFCIKLRTKSKWDWQDGSGGKNALAAKPDDMRLISGALIKVERSNFTRLTCSLWYNEHAHAHTY